MGGFVSLGDTYKRVSSNAKIELRYNILKFIEMNPAGVFTLFLPFLGELYWMFKMFGENDTYAYIALTHLILAIPFSMFGRGDR